LIYRNKANGTGVNVFLGRKVQGAMGIKAKEHTLGERVLGRKY
jgi:hypothetical protein